MAEEKKTTKAKRPTAKKRDIQNEKKRLNNRILKSQVKTAMRSFEKAAAENNEAGVKEKLSTIYSLIDKGVKRGIYKINKAGRFKSKIALKK